MTIINFTLFRPQIEYKIGTYNCYSLEDTNFVIYSVNGFDIIQKELERCETVSEIQFKLANMGYSRIK